MGLACRYSGLKQAYDSLMSLVTMYHPCSSLEYSTGLKYLDVALDGGLKTGQWIELVGPSATGKTQLCHYLAGSSCRFNDKKVLYISSGCSIFPRRLVQLTGHLERVMMHTCYTAQSLMNLLEKLDSSEYHLIIVDAVGLLLAPYLGTLQGAQLVSQTVESLLQFARSSRLPIVVKCIQLDGESCSNEF